MLPHLFYWVVGCTGIIRNINRQCFRIKSIIDIVIAVVCTANCDIIGWSVIITYYISILVKGEIFIFMRSIYPFGVKLSMICRHTLFKSNYFHSITPGTIPVSYTHLTLPTTQLV